MIDKAFITNQDIKTEVTLTLPSSLPLKTRARLASRTLLAAVRQNVMMKWLEQYHEVEISGVNRYGFVGTEDNWWYAKQSGNAQIQARRPTLRERYESQKPQTSLSDHA